MKKTLSVALALILALALQAKPGQATSEQVARVESPCWWVGMKTELQLLVQGSQISDYEVAFEKGPKVTKV